MHHSHWLLFTFLFVMSRPIQISHIERSVWLLFPPAKPQATHTCGKHGRPSDHPLRLVFSAEVASVLKDHDVLNVALDAWGSPAQGLDGWEAASKAVVRTAQAQGPPGLLGLWKS